MKTWQNPPRQQHCVSYLKNGNFSIARSCCTSDSNTLLNRDNLRPSSRTQDDYILQAMSPFSSNIRRALIYTFRLLSLLAIFEVAFYYTHCYFRAGGVCFESDHYASVDALLAVARMLGLYTPEHELQAKLAAFRAATNPPLTISAPPIFDQALTLPAKASFSRDIMVAGCHALSSFA